MRQRARRRTIARRVGEEVWTRDLLRGISARLVQAFMTRFEERMRQASMVPNLVVNLLASLDRDQLSEQEIEALCEKVQAIVDEKARVHT
jgi:hypothetical protein